MRLGLAVAVAGVAALLVLPLHAAAQARGMPLLFESTYGYASRMGVYVGHGGELDGVSALVEGAYHLGVGQRRRVAFTGAAGLWDPPNESKRFSGAVGAQVRLDPRGPIGRISKFTVRAIAGLAVVNDMDRARISVPIGIGAAYAFIFPVVHIEPWIVPHLVWLPGHSNRGPGAVVPASEHSVRAAVSAGVTAGAAKMFGIRIGAECCVGGLAMSYGLSTWF